MDRPAFNPAAFDAAPKNKVKEPVATDRPLFDPAAVKAQREEAKQADIALYDRPLGPIKAWSFSALSEFEQCPYRSYLKKVEKAKEPSGPAADRGSLLHQYIEDYIQHKRDDLPAEVKKHRELIDELRTDYADGIVEVEGDWGFTKDWEITGWTDDDVWARIKLDAIRFDSETSAYVVDWKSGKKFGNEMKHASQLMIYAIAAFKRYPKLEYVEGVMKYIDNGQTLDGKYTRKDLAMFLPKWEKRALIMTTATDFPPKPSAHNCKWCRLKAPLEGEEKARCQWGAE